MPEELTPPVDETWQKLKMNLSDENILRQALFWHLGNWVRYEAIVDLLWGYRRDGGPLDTRSVIIQYLFRLRQRGCDLEVWRGVAVRMVTYNGPPPRSPGLRTGSRHRYRYYS